MAVHINLDISLLSRSIDCTGLCFFTDGSSYCDGSVMVMKTGDVYFITLKFGSLLGQTESENVLPLIPVKITELCGEEIRGYNC